jgi:uncharacterized protein YjbI with pentapeptide repeats
LGFLARDSSDRFTRTIKTLKLEKRTMPKIQQADLTRAKFQSQISGQNVQNIAQIIQDVDFSGAILAQVDFRDAMFGPIRCDYFYTDQDRTMRHPPTETLNAGAFCPANLEQRKEQ